MPRKFGDLKVCGGLEVWRARLRRKLEPRICKSSMVELRFQPQFPSTYNASLSAILVEAGGLQRSSSFGGLPEEGEYCVYILRHFYSRIGFSNAPRELQHHAVPKGATPLAPPPSPPPFAKIARVTRAIVCQGSLHGHQNNFLQQSPQSLEHHPWPHSALALPSK